MSIFVSAALSAALLMQQAAPAAMAPAAEDQTTVEGVTVTAKSKPDQEAIEAFVGSVAAETGTKRLGRWDRKICPGVIGMRNDYARLMLDRIAETALEIGLEVGEPGCKANMIVIATAESDKLARDMVDKYADAFAKYDGGIRPRRKKLDAFIVSPEPVRWWHVTRRTNADGQRYDLGDSVSVRDVGRIKATTREDFDRVIIILDVTRIGKVKYVSLADYIAMVGLAQVDPEADTASVATVLNLFSDREAGLTPPETMTSWDKAYLKGLYAARRDARRGVQQERDMVRTMTDELAAPKDPKAK